MKKIFVIIFSLTAICFVHGKAIPSINSMGVSGIAMGNTGTGMMNSASSLQYNPASARGENAVWLEHSIWYMGSFIDNVGLIYSLGEGLGAIGANIRFTQADNIVGMDENGDSLGTLFSYRYVSGELDYSYYKKDYSAGLGLLYYMENNADAGYSGIILKAGLQYTVYSELMDVNMGIGMNNLILNNDTPYEVRMGADVDYKDAPLGAAIDMGYNSDRGIIAGLGVRYNIIDAMNIYAGYEYKADNAINGITAGVDIYYQSVKIGYAPRFASQFGMTHTICAEFMF